MKRDSLEAVLEIGIIPVIRARSSDEALRAVDAIVEGEIRIIEITMTVPGAIDVIRDLSSKVGQDVLIGAGTVLDAPTARLCILAGAKFIVSPCFNDDVIRFCRRYSVLAVPGALTPSEILSCWEKGADIVKVFPVDNVGGPAYIKALQGPFPNIPVNVTGGITLANASAYIKAGAAAISVGSSLIDKESLATGNYKNITERAKRFLEEVDKGRN